MAKMNDQTIINSIYFVRGQKIMLDRDLAEMYGVTTGNLNKAVSRNKKRFPKDFMFRLTATEFKNLIFQNGISRWGGTRYLPVAFTEQGVAMLSSVLNSDTAIAVNIRIIRVFTKMRQILLTNKDILAKLESLEKKIMKHEGRLKKSEDDIQLIFGAIKELLNPPQPARRRIGFRRSDEIESRLFS